MKEKQAVSQQYKKVFISYSHNDSDFVEKFYGQLKKDGVTCFFDKESIKWGDNWVGALERGLEKSDIIIPVLSPNYLESEWSKVECLCGFSDDPSGKNRIIRPLMYKQCRASGFLKNIQHIDVQTSHTFKQNYPTILKELSLKRPQSRSPEYDKYLYCNRDKQVMTFKDTFELLYTNSPGYPQFYVVHGHECQRHDLLVERLRLETKDLFSTNNRWKHCVSQPVITISLSDRDSLDNRKRLFKEKMYRKLREKSFLENIPLQTAQSMSSVCKHMSFRQNETLFFRFIVQGKNWNKHHIPLINWIISHYFSRGKFNHQFVVIFEINYSNLFFQILSGYPKWFIRHRLKYTLISESCKLLHELHSFRRSDIDNWLIDHLDQNPNALNICKDCDISRFQFYVRFLRMKQAERLLKAIEKKYYEAPQIDFI
jgi:hypothetical protein